MLGITIILFNEPTSYSSARVLSALLTSMNIDCNVIIFNDELKPSDVIQLKNNNTIKHNIIAINLRRCDLIGLLDDRDIFITWVQDEIDWMYNVDDKVKRWNDSYKDWIIGYTDRCRNLGYNQDKLIEMPFLMLESDYNVDIQDNKFITTDIAFAGNKCGSISDYMNIDVRNYCNANSIDFIGVCALVNDMIAHYMDGYKICGYDALNSFISHSQPKLYEQLININNPKVKYYFINIMLYWFVNEKIYRFTVLDWFINSGMSIKLAGIGWHANGKYSKYSVGYINNHKLPEFYKSCKYALHLNSMESFHHRPSEILLSNGGKLLMRGNTGESAIIKPSIEFDKDLYFKTQSLILKHIIYKIFNGNLKEKSPDISYLYRTHEFGIKIDGLDNIKAHL